MNSSRNFLRRRVSATRVGVTRSEGGGSAIVCLPSFSKFGPTSALSGEFTADKPTSKTSRFALDEPNEPTHSEPRGDASKGKQDPIPRGVFGEPSPDHQGGG